MAKTLKQILELYKPKAKDEQKFAAKHVVVKTDDANKNGDDVFQGTNVKTINRTKDHHGYNPGEDEKVYEEVEQIDELSKKTLGSYAKKANQSAMSAAHAVGSKRGAASDEHINKMFKRKAGVNKAVDRLTKEEVEQIDELSSETRVSYAKKALKQYDDAYGEVKKTNDETRKTQLRAIMKKRGRGVGRIMREDTVSDESIKLLELYANLNDENRAHMMEMFDSDQQDVLISFATQATESEENNG